MAAGLEAHGVSAADAHRTADLPAVSILFAAFLGYDPISHLLGTHALAGLSPADHAALTGHSFFPGLISGPFQDGLHAAFAFAIAACLIAALASFLRGGRPTEDPDGDVGEPRPDHAAPPSPIAVGVRQARPLPD
jgi:hypothetical protein